MSEYTPYNSFNRRNCPKCGAHAHSQPIDGWDVDPGQTHWWCTYEQCRWEAIEQYDGYLTEMRRNIPSYMQS
jgi:hypothetical protein